MTEKDLPIGNRMMDKAWYRDRRNVVHTGESLMLACLLHVKKGRTNEAEEDFKELFVFNKSKKTVKAHKQRSKSVL